MTNRYFNNSFAPAVGSAIKSAALVAQLNALASAFTLVQNEVDSIPGKSGIVSLPGFPASFAGSGYRAIRVNVAESAVEFAAMGSTAIKTISATTYTLLAADAGYLLVFTAGTAVTVTVPPNATAAFVAGEPVYLMQKGGGAVTLVASGCTLYSSDGLLSTRTAYAAIGLQYLGGNEWVVIGDRNVGSTLGYPALSTTNTFTKAQSVTPVALTDATTIATDASLGNTFYVTIAATGRTLANPTNLVTGTRYRWYIKQDATGSRTITTYGANFKFVGGTPTLTTAANAVDLIEGEYIAALGQIYCNVSKNFA